MSLPLSIHCELGPILVNRTAVFRICKNLPIELKNRGFKVRPFALLARLNKQAETGGWWGRRALGVSRRLLLAALRYPNLFLKTRSLIRPLLSWRRGRAFPLILDPLYLLFHPDLKAGVVVVYDTTPVTEPHWHPPAVSKLYKAAFTALAQSGCHVVAVSRNTADHLRVNYGMAPSQITVLPLGLAPQPAADGPPPGSVLIREGEAPAEPVFSARREPRPPEIGRHSPPQQLEPFLLFVGNIEPRKNIRGLLDGYRRANLYPAHGVRLRIIGQVCDPADPVLSQARMTPGVDLLGFVPEETLAASYRQCLGFVYPSFCEGFGLPLLESLHHGCICLSTSTGASPEIGGDAVLSVDPYSVNDIANGMLKLIRLTPEERSLLSERARRRASRFTWQRFHDGLAVVLRSEVCRALETEPPPHVQPVWLTP